VPGNRGTELARSFLRGIAVCAIASTLAVGGQAPSLGQDADATALFRDEVADAPSRIRWKESSLSDETRFAIAASGLSWRPAWNEQPLIVALKGKSLGYSEGAYRLNSFMEARRQRANKMAFAYALSLVLDPPEYDTTGWMTAYGYLRGYGSDFDKALVGIVDAPEKMPLLHDYRHAAADLLVFRASPRLLPLFLGLSGADDRYLRSRGIAALGLTAFRSERGVDDTIKGLRVETRELGISAVQIAMIDDVVRKAAEDRDYRVRAAASLALGLIGGEANVAQLRKMMKDRAYIRQETGNRDSASVSFPVRFQAARSLERFGEKNLNDGSGLYDARSVGTATRGGLNITKEAVEARKKIEHTIRFHDGDW
jgi:hypothetical protein